MTERLRAYLLTPALLPFSLPANEIEVRAKCDKMSHYYAAHGTGRFPGGGGHVQKKKILSKLRDLE